MPFDESLIEWDKPTTGFDPSLIKWDEEKPSIDTEVQSGEALPGYETPEPLTWADRWQRFKESLGGGPITLPEIPKAAGPYLGQLLLGPAKDIVPPSIKAEYVEPLAHTLATAGKGLAEFSLTPEGAIATAASAAQPELAPYIMGAIGASQIPGLPEREARYAEQTISKDPYERMAGWFGAITDPIMTGLMTSGAPIAAGRKFAIEPPKPTIPIERTSDAIQRKTTPVLQPVRPQPVEGVREMPIVERLEEAGKRGEPTPKEAGEQPTPQEGTATLGDVERPLNFTEPEINIIRDLKENLNTPEKILTSSEDAIKLGSKIKSQTGLDAVREWEQNVASKAREDMAKGQNRALAVSRILKARELRETAEGKITPLSKEILEKAEQPSASVPERPVEFEEPPKPQGTVRLYRGRDNVGGTAVTSEHFTANREYSRKFAGAGGEVDYVDVPINKLPKAWEERKETGTGVKYWKLDKNIVNEAKPLPVQRKAIVYDLETPTGDVPEPKTTTTESINKAEQAPKPTGPPPTNAATDQDRMIGVHFNEPNGPPQSRALGIVSSITPTFTQAIKTVSENVKNAFPWVREHWREAAMLQAPKLTDLNREAGESGVRFASSFLFGRQHGLMFAEKVLDGLNVKAEQFGVALSEDNLRDLRRSYTEEARKLGESGKLDEANQVMEQANAVQTLIGKKNSPFKTEDQYQEFLNRDDVKEAIRRHIQLWKEQKDPMYRKANDLDPETPLATRGLQTGARINLKAIMEGDKPIHGIGLPRFRQLITLKRRDPFARRATGAGKVYEGNYHELMANGFEREMPVATQHEFYKKLIDTGIGKVQSKEFVSDLTINGEATKAILLKLNPWRNQWLHVPLSVFEEVKTISGLDQQPQLKVFKKFNDLMTGLSIQGFAEGTTHASNLLTQVFTGLGPTANPMINAVLKSVGRSDLLITLPRVLSKSFSNQREAMLKLAEIGAAKTPYSGRMGWLLNRIDQGVRLVSAENYRQMAEAGWVENTETGLREYVNQVGNYNKRLQPYLIRKLRETGIQPFATAMQTFNIMGVRRMAMAPGAKASSNAAALALRADIAAGWLGTLLIPAMINTLISGKPSGVEGTNIGSIGWRDDKGKLQQIPVLRIAGFERGARITGVLPAVEAYRKGLGHRHAAEAALTAIGGTGMRTVAGPGPEFLYMSATGKRIGLPMIQTAPAAPPTDSMSPFKNQFAMNVQQALIESSPLANSTYDFWHNKDWSEIGKRQFTRFWPTSGMTEEMQRALPKILERKDAMDYGDWLAKQAKKKPMQERAAFVNEQLKKDKVEPRFLKAIYEEVRKKGTYKYQ